MTFLVGQQELLAQKTALQIAGKTLIVARLMVEELAFYGIRHVDDVATCLNGYNQTAYPAGSAWSFTCFYVPAAFDAGYWLVDDAGTLGTVQEIQAVRVSAVPGNVVARLMGPDIDPYEGVVPQLGAVNVARLHVTLGIPMAPLEIALLHPSQRRRYSPLFRHCRRCIARGYHSVLHQLLNLNTCPAHYRPLETACRRCGYEAPYVVNVRLLESPYRCAFCGGSYGGGGWSPDTVRPMKPEYRKALTRRYYERHLG